MFHGEHRVENKRPLPWHPVRPRVRIRRRRHRSERAERSPRASWSTPSSTRPSTPSPSVGHRLVRPASGGSATSSRPPTWQERRRHTRRSPPGARSSGTTTTSNPARSVRLPGLSSARPVRTATRSPSSSSATAVGQHGAPLGLRVEQHDRGVRPAQGQHRPGTPPPLPRSSTAPAVPPPRRRRPRRARVALDRTRAEEAELPGPLRTASEHVQSASRPGGARPAGGAPRPRDTVRTPSMPLAVSCTTLRSAGVHRLERLLVAGRQHDVAPPAG